MSFFFDKSNIACFTRQAKYDLGLIMTNKDDQSAPRRKMPELPAEKTLTIFRRCPHRLRLVQYDRRRRIVHDLPNREMVAGSARDCQIRIDDPTVSAHHFAISCDGIFFVIRDLASTNGTWVEGVRVKEVYLSVGSTIVAGRTTLHGESADDTKRG
jgi:pSer/pThr/pTyr-binding forkhead associated (FHA) protein